jgi:hypothetical protein
LVKKNEKLHVTEPRTNNMELYKNKIKNERRLRKLKMSDFVPTEDLAAVSLANSAGVAAPADTASSATATSTEGAIEDTTAAEEPTAEVTKTARAIVDDQNFFRENLPRAAILSLNREYITCVIM